MTRMLRQGVPPSIAQTELNGFYAPGERGRPQTAKSKAAYRAATSPFASPLNRLTGGG
jgi:hypothetical protein